MKKLPHFAAPNKTTPLLSLLLISITLLAPSSQITKSCSASSQCPSNSYCSSSFCLCNEPYILDCSTSAPFLTSEYQTLTLTNVSDYYQTQTQSPEIYYNFMFQICASAPILQKYSLVFQLWVDTGADILTKQDNFVGKVSVNLQDLVDIGQCVDFVQYQIKFDKQPNGQTQNLIVQLDIQEDTQADQVDDPTADVKMRVIITELISSSLMKKLGIGIGCGVLFLVGCAIAYCFYKKHKRRVQYQAKLSYNEQLVQQFKNCTPSQLAKTAFLPTMSSCSICLCEYQPQQHIRKIVCAHVFHMECIDSWCLKNLSCPVCRQELDRDSILKKKKQVQMSDYNWQKNTLSQREGLLGD